MRRLPASRRAVRFLLHPVLLCVILLATSCARESRVEPRVFENAPVILISVDTLRADHLPAYGYAGVATPAIDRLRADSILYTNAVSHCPLTFPSHVSILTGKLPTETGVRDNVGYRFDSAAHATMPALLKTRGYATGGAVSAYVLRADTGLGRSFDWYDDATEAKRNVTVGELQRSGDKTAGSAANWVEGQGANPFFLFLHLYEPHTPYEPPEPYRSRYASSPYDGEVAVTDEILGTFLDRLRASGVYDRAIIIFTSDHGEGLGDHGEDEHGVFLYREAIHVPLMVKLPKNSGAGSKVDVPVQLIDLFPTVGALTGVAFPAQSGSSLLDFADPKRASSERAIYSETYYPQIHFGWSRLRSLTGPRFHYVEAPRPELYDYIADPKEKSDRSEAERRTRASMRSSLQTVEEKFSAPSNVDPEEAAKLAALGYLGSTAAPSSGPLPDPKDRIGLLRDFREGTALVQAGRNQQAVERFRAVLATDPGITDVWAQLGKAYEQMGRYEDALAAYKEAAQRAPAVATKFVLSMASAYLYMNDIENAESHARAGYNADPHLANLVLGIVALERRNFPAAEAHARAAMSSALYRDGAVVLLARSSVRQGRAAEAVESLDQLGREIEERGGEPPPLFEFVRGDALMRLGRVGEAEQAFLKEIELYPGDTEAYGSLGAIYMTQGTAAKADAIMERMANANPRPDGYAMAVQLFTHFGDEKRAAKWRQRLERASESAASLRTGR